MRRMILSGAESRAPIMCGAVLAVMTLLSVSMTPTWISAAQGARTESGTASGQALHGSGQGTAEYVILFVLEGVGERSLSTGPMPALSHLVEEGSVTWSATNPTPDLRLPSVASIFTGLPMEKHGVTWDQFDFARGYPRAPTLFDYIDLSGGKDTAAFFMDESLYQLARPEPYIDYQVCGPLRPECDSDTLVKYIRDYMVKGASGEGYGRRILSLPHLLVVHLPEAGWIGRSAGWDSQQYHQALQHVDRAMGSVIEIYRDLKLLERATVFVMSLNPDGGAAVRENGHGGSRVPWIAWGYGIRAGHEITQPVLLQDTGATVMRTFGLHTHTEWDSRSVEEVFDATKAVTTGEMEQHDHGR